MGSHPAGPSTEAAGALGAGCMEDDEEEEEVTAATLRGGCRPLPLCALSSFSYIPPRRPDPKEHSYYSRQGEVRRGGLHSGAGARAGGTDPEEFR